MEKSLPSDIVSIEVPSTSKVDAGTDEKFCCEEDVSRREQHHHHHHHHLRGSENWAKRVLFWLQNTVHRISGTDEESSDIVVQKLPRERPNEGIPPVSKADAEANEKSPLTSW